MEQLQKLQELIENKATVSEIELAYIEYILSYCKENKSQAAKILGIDRRTLYRKFPKEMLELRPGVAVRLVSGEEGEIVISDNKKPGYYIVRLTNGALGSYHGELIDERTA